MPDVEETAVYTPVSRTQPAHSWLAGWLLRQDDRLISRFAYYFKRLQTWPRHLQQKLAYSLAGAALLLALSSTPDIQAATLTVSAGAAGIASGDGCSLVEAIENANADAQLHTECPAGDSADVIILAGGTYAYTTAHGNYAVNYDAALPNITSDITIQGNGAAVQGPSDGSMRVLTVTSTGNLTLNDATISGGGDTGDVNAFLAGGGIANYGTLTVNRSTISGNGAMYGGGIYNRDGTVTVQDSVISGNVAQAGGGIESYADAGNASVSIEISTIANNSAVYGGGTHNRNGDITLNNSTFSGNSAAEWGGGIFNYGVYYGSGTVTLNNSTISGNTANRGGGVYNYGTDYGTAEVTLYNSTVSGNTAVFGGGGLENNGRYDGSATLTLHRTIVSGNSAPSGPNVYQDSAILNANDYNLLGENSASGIIGGTANTGGTDIVPGSGILINNILNTTLAQNGVNPHPYTHALVTDSPAIDAAPSAACVAAPVNNIDQRGAARNVDGNGTASGSECDIGAFEYGSTQTPTAVSLQTTHAQTGSPAPAAAATGLLMLLSGWLLRKKRGRGG
ncbi:MAG: hypothetical protein KC441_16070 [Anaerolineales bacterium]|nr:hypothetical protein [Anaerolineales bacterium]